MTAMSPVRGAAPKLKNTTTRSGPHFSYTISPRQSPGDPPGLLRGVANWHIGKACPVFRQNSHQYWRLAWPFRAAIAFYLRIHAPVCGSRLIRSMYAGTAAVSQYVGQRLRANLSVPFF